MEGSQENFFEISFAVCQLFSSDRIFSRFN